MADEQSSGSDDEQPRIFAGRFEYQKPLGKGAGGAVYLAEDLHNDRRRVALKVLTEEACESVQGKMLRREFEILSKLDHPNLVRVYDYGTLPGGGVYLAEEYIDGFSLQDARALLEPETHIDIARQVLLGLAYLHGMGMIHRDVKPANIMLLWLNEESTRPMVKLVDFGLSSMNPGSDSLRGGTRSYMAPEIIRGNKGEFRSDLFSLGVSLYYALCGVLPFGPRSKEDPPPTEEDLSPPSPHRYNPEVPLTLSRFTMVLLRQVEGVAYEDAGEALQTLARDTERAEWWSGRTFANNLDVAAAPVLRGYFERGILGRRVGERERLVEIVAEADQEAPGQFHYVRGGPEIGKTRLISDVTASLKIEGCTVVQVDCTQQMHAWELVHELLSRIVELGASRGMRQLEYYESYLLILKRLATLDDDTDTQLSQVVDHEWLRRAFEVAVEKLRPQKLVVVIEDLHRADIASRQFLAECYDADDGTTMPEALATGLGDQTFEIIGEGERVDYHDIEGLTQSDIRRFFEGRLGIEGLDEEWIDQIDECASGRPGYLEEVCRTLIDEGLLHRRSVASWTLDREALEEFTLPESLRASFRRRFASIGASEREVLELLSLFERPVRWEALREFVASGADSIQETDQTLESLRRRYLARMHIEVDGRYLALVDSILGEVVRDLMSPSWKRGLHRRIGDYLREAWRAGDLPSEESAMHLQVAGEQEGARQMYETAGDQNYESTDFGAAHEAYRAALETTDSGPSQAYLLAKKARVLLTLYQPAASRELLEDAGEMAERTGLDWLVSSVCLTGAEVTLVMGDDDGVERWISRLEDCLPSAGQQAPALEYRAAVARRCGEFGEASKRLKQATKRVRHFGQHGRMASICAEQGDIEDWRGNAGRADHLFAKALEVAESFGDDFGRAEIKYRQGVAYRRRGEVDKGASAIEDALETLSRGLRPDLWIEALSQIALCKAELGDDEAARRYAADAFMFASEFGNEMLLERVRFDRAELRLRETDHPERILSTMKEAIERIRRADTLVPEFLEMSLRYGSRLADFGDEAGVTVVEEARERAEQIGAGSLRGSVQATSGE